VVLNEAVELGKSFGGTRPPLRQRRAREGRRSAAPERWRARGTSLNEFEIIRRYFDRAPNRALLGIGDDCALVRPNAGSSLPSPPTCWSRAGIPARRAPRSLGTRRSP